MSKKCPILHTNSTNRLREKRTKGREGVKNPENFAYVLYECPLMRRAAVCLKVTNTRKRLAFYVKIPEDGHAAQPLLHRVVGRRRRARPGDPDQGVVAVRHHDGPAERRNELI